tara:strand:+ start:810 stop:1031 length:222 start_codon:yes stop_codon:yes gene_type:complete
MTVEKRYNNIMSRFKKEADLPIHFTDLTEEQKVLVEMISDSEVNKEKIKTINEAVILVQNDLDFVLHELNKIS